MNQCHQQAMIELVKVNRLVSDTEQSELSFMYIAEEGSHSENKARKEPTGTGICSMIIVM